MNVLDIFAFLREDILTAVLACNDGCGKPVTCAVNVMDFDGDGLYFLTAKKKALYGRLKAEGYISLTGIKGESTMTSIAVSVRGKVRQLGEDYVEGLLEKNTYLYEIYPTPQSRGQLAAFMLYEGEGAWFDLSKKPAEQFAFSFGKALADAGGKAVQ